MTKPEDKVVPYFEFSKNMLTSPFKNKVNDEQEFQESIYNWRKLLKSVNDLKEPSKPNANIHNNGDNVHYHIGHDVGK